MREHPLVPTLRLALLCLFTLAIWPWMPEAAMCVPMFLFPNCTCCGGTCKQCTSGSCHSSYQLVFTGIVEGTCGSCSSVNATFTINPYDCGGAASDCFTGQSPFTGHCNTGRAVSLAVKFFGATTYIEIVLGNTATDAYYYLYQTGDIGGGSAIDCNFSSQAVAYSTWGTNTGGSNICDGTASSCSLTAL